MEKTEKNKLVNLSKSNVTVKNKSLDYLDKDEKKEKEKIRFYIFDNIKGILIFTVVFAHFLWNYAKTNKYSLSRKIVVFVYFFHMHGFIFISGFLSSENATKISNAFKLIILHYIFNFSFSVIIYFYTNSEIGFLFPKYSYWYLLSLFYWRIAIKYISNLKFIFTISIIISLLEGYAASFTNILSVVRTIGFFPYFLLGYKIAKSGKFNSFLKWRKGLIKFIIFFVSFVFFLFLFISYINKNTISNYALLMFSYTKYNTIKMRIIIMIISFTMILFFLLLTPNTKIPIINKWGRNSLFIYLFHRIFTVIADKEFFKKAKYSNHIIELSISFTFIMLSIFGSDFVSKNCMYVLNSIHKNLVELNKKGKIIAFILCLSFIGLLLINPIEIYINQVKIYQKRILKANTLLYSKQTSKPDTSIKKENIKDEISNSIRISYVGDLILLKDQVIAAKNNITGKYEFDEMFQYTSKHFHESDYTIAIYEGPSAGNTTSYSTSNFGDGLPLYLNFPDEFAEAVKKAGIDLVSTTNNHLLDKKIKGAMRTLDILDKYNITHVGSYRNQEEKDKIEIIDVKGIKIAVLAYTSIMNYYKIDTLYEKYNYLTRIIPKKKKTKYYNEIYEEIKNDFIKVKKSCPDIIMVLAHMGTQFLHHTNELQDEWNKIFTDLGADIILGDHSHSLQPLQYIGNTFIVN